MSKKYLKGFAELGYRKVLANESGTYTLDTAYTEIPGAQSCSPDDNREDFEIPADDGIWDSGSEWKKSVLTITIVETELTLLADLTGAAISNGVVQEGTLDEAPEIALTFSALRADGGYRLFCYYACKCTGYKVSHNTKGSNNNAQAYELTFECLPRRLDRSVRAAKDVDKGASHDWLRSAA